MNVEQLKKNVGSSVKIRPVAIRRDATTGEILPQIDDDWIITRIEGGKVTLQNTRTDHVKDLGNDSVKEYRSTGHLLLRVQLTLSGQHVRLEPITGEGGDRRSSLTIELPSPVNGIGHRSPPLHCRLGRQSTTDGARIAGFYY
jgi:hypothetical protein